METTLASATLYLTEECNSRCRTCNLWRHKAPAPCSAEKWRNVIDQLKGTGIKHFCFCGGEPFLYPDIFELLDYAVEPGYFIEIYSNGLLLDDEKTARLLSVGIQRLNLSMDGLEATHDHIRGVKGSFKNLQKISSHLADKPIQLIFHSNLLEENLAEMPDLFSLARKCKARWSPNIINTSQRSFQKTGADRLAPVSIEKIDSFIRFIRQDLTSPTPVAAIEKKHLPFLETMLKNGGRPPVKSCIIGREAVYITSKLDVLSGCNVLPAMGNLQEHSLKEIMESDNYKQRLVHMENMNCPGCTCSVWSNINFALEQDEHAS